MQLQIIICTKKTTIYGQINVFCCLTDYLSTFHCVLSALFYYIQVGNVFKVGKWFSCISEMFTFVTVVVSPRLERTTIDKFAEM